MKFIILDRNGLFADLNKWFMRQPEIKLRRYVSAQLLVVEICEQFFLQKQTEQENQTERANETQQIKRETTQIATDLDEQPALKRVKQEPENAKAD